MERLWQNLWKRWKNLWKRWEIYGTYGKSMENGGQKPWNPPKSHGL
jgi:hypothetical protein